ncbi:peptidoglycan DD-metalloendopeptidase family protein [Spirosoma validum]|uniref:Peptidoglycan DD-metalloendopeptidase family protein n=1 Tax=Spirosoma validum TaxID=2771355 RepID=A0A927AXR9_9BACT|nr:peptidoglycan DD-metalloendopeptidase family protein [Spirosoma validum]MBD2751637.1 peptidoglycan DD-metalloendopeptidase family protein [Spirosoma validum]
MIVNRLFYSFWIALLISWVSACTGVGPNTSLFRPTSPREQYGQSLKSAKLDRTALGTDWLEAGERALRDSLKITVPYRESGYFSANKAFAVGYRLDAQRGDRFLIRVETQGQKATQVFIDVFSLEERNRTTLITASKADTNVVSWEPRKTQSFLIRVQPELLRSGSYTISITREPALAFPVQGRDSRQISSYFGAPRDGGRRRHEGVDIFAPKGTPAVASVDGVITGVGSNSLGGNVAFLIDNERSIRLYYAHLDRWNVTNGQRVSVGDTVGYVGNTGNARTTGPHLHFGIYGTMDGATDPLPFIRLGRGPAKQPLVATSRLGDTVRVSVARSIVRSAPHSDAPIVRELPKASALTIQGGTETWLRVEMPDGRTGYIAGSTIEASKRSLQRLTLSAGNLLDAADNQAAVIKNLRPGSSVDVLAVTNSFQLVRSTDGLTGWLPLTIDSNKPAKATVR